MHNIYTTGLAGYAQVRLLKNCFNFLKFNSSIDHCVSNLNKNSNRVSSATFAMLNVNVQEF